MSETLNQPLDALRRVMCVEDDPDIRMILAFCLRQIGGYEVHCCADGPTALAEVEAFAPDLVLLDVMMPGMSGPETLAGLRALASLDRVPVVFLTAKALLEEIEALLEHGATGVIVKPFDPVTLPGQLRIYWEHGRGPAR